MYQELKKDIKPLDLMFVKGSEVISRGIRFIQKATLGVEHMGDVWSHVGLVVTRDFLNDPRLEKRKLYLLESTLSGKYNDGVKNIDGEAFFGVQIRDLDEVVKAYVKNKKASIGWARLHNNPYRDESPLALLKQKRIRDQFSILYPLRWEGIRYDFNLISLAAAVWPIFKPLRYIIFKFNLFNSDDWLYCSELVFDVLQVFKFYDPRFDPSSVLPQDLLGYDNSSPSIPKIFDDPIVILHVK